MERLRRGVYSEETLVEKIASERQKNSYRENNRFKSGKHRQLFLNTLSRYCEYEFDKTQKKYIVTKVKSFPLLYSDDSKILLYENKIHHNIYQFVVPSILRAAMNGKFSEDNEIFYPVGFAKKIGLIKEDFIIAKFNQSIISKELLIPSNIVSEYFNKAEGKIKNITIQCLKYLEALECIEYSEVLLISYLPKNAEIKNGHIIVVKEQPREATAAEVSLYRELSNKVCEELEINKNEEKWYGKKSFLYLNKLNKLLKEHNIEYFRKAIKIVKVDKAKCKELIKTFDSTENRAAEELGNMLIKNAEVRASKNNMPDVYVDTFRELTALTFPEKVGSILESIPALSERKFRNNREEQYTDIEYVYVKGG